MFALLIIALAAAPDCETACGIKASRCFSSCRGATRCAGKCDRSQGDCLAGCARREDDDDTAARAKKKTPCGALGDTRTVRPCADDEQKLIKDALASKQAKALCRDEDGALTACPKDLAKAQELYDSIKNEGCAADGGQCTND